MARFSWVRLAACLAVLGMIVVQGAAAVGAVDRATASWTFMVYLDGDNNLESFGVEDFMEMSSVGSDSQVNIVVQFDRGTHSTYDGGSSDYGDWSSTKRFKVDRGETPTSANQVMDLGEVNMGSAASLQSFLEWGMGTYPASKYALVLWDHGGTWLYGACADDTSDGDSLLMPEIRQAISAAEGSTSKRVNLVGFDACLMGMVEVAYDLKDLTDTVVFSEEIEPGQGWAYDDVLGGLTTDPSMTSLQLGAKIVTAYSEFYGASGKETLSAISTSSLAGVATALSAFASEMSSAYPAHSAQIVSVRSTVEHFDYEMAIDLYDLAQRTKGAAITPQLTSASDQLMTSVQAAVISETSGNLRPGAHGLSLYFPDVRSDLNLVGYRSDILMTADTTWDEFLETYFQQASSDQWEPDDTYSQASQLAIGVAQYHSILEDGADVDWAKFTLASSADILIETSGVDGDTEMYLFTEADVPSSYIAYDDDGGIDRFSRISQTLPAGTYYVLVREYGQNQGIDSYQLKVSMPLSPDDYEPNDTPAQANYISVGSSQLHSIGQGGADVDWMYFTLDSVQSVLIETWGVAGDTRVWLYEESGSNLYLIDSDDDTGQGLFSRLAESDLPAGTYFINVEEYYNNDEIDAYYLNLSSYSLVDVYEPNDDYQHATDLQAGGEQMHSIGDSGQDVDWFQFELYSDSSVYVETYGPEGDTQLYLYSSDGSSQIGEDDDSGDGYFSLLLMDDLEQGQYFVRIVSYEGFFGQDPISEYGIVLYTDPSPPTALTAQMSGPAVALQWAAPISDGGLGIDHYELLRAPYGSAPSTYRSVQGTSFLDTNITIGAGYSYSVLAVNELGTGKATAPVQIQTSGGVGIPGTVNWLTFDQQDGDVIISWAQPDANGSAIIGYHVFRGAEPDGTDRAEIGESTSTSYTDSSVEGGKTYYYWVVAENGNGMGIMPSSTAVTTADDGIGGISLLLIGGIVAAIAVVLVIVLLLARGRKGPARQAGQVPPPASQPAQTPTRCPNCGAPVEGTQFCGHCGRKLY
ncbi:MAG: clostripain-related cysteine peptidase [Methanomassiliicoccales archaeon]|nr:clostripain-related cysteine peptidase [Methanomassiliicoccales archaeon]